MKGAYVTMKVYWDESKIEIKGPSQLKDIIEDGDDSLLHYFITSVGGISVVKPPPARDLAQRGISDKSKESVHSWTVKGAND